MKISELELGKTYTFPLVVKTATSRLTKAKKPFLTVEFFDGFSTISGNYWDWSGKNIPDKNTILNVTAQVGEWQGSMQLTISCLSTNTDLTLADFMPLSGHDISAVYLEASSIIEDLSDSFFKVLGKGVLEELSERWRLIPGAVKVHHAYAAGTLIHSVSTAKIAKAIAVSIPEASVELVVIGALLHDIGKLFCYTINGVVCELTDEGLLHEHSFTGANFISGFTEEHNLLNSSADEAKLEMLQHIILSHHGKCEFGAAVPPSSIEAHIVHHADVLDASVEQIRVASDKVGESKWTERIWTLDNRAQLSTGYVQAVMDRR